MRRITAARRQALGSGGRGTAAFGRVLLVALLASAACRATPPREDRSLLGAWRLVELESYDDRIGVVRPEEPARYEMRLADDGRATLRLDCNRGMGRWTASATGPTQGSLELTELATTRAACPAGSLEPRVARELPYVRSYRIEGDRLRLLLMADGGSQLWSRAAE